MADEQTSVRAFVAIDSPEGVRANVARVQGELKRLDGRIRAETFFPEPLRMNRHFQKHGRDAFRCVPLFGEQNLRRGTHRRRLE